MIDVEAAPIIYIQAQAHLVARVLADLETVGLHYIAIAGAEAE